MSRLIILEKELEFSRKLLNYISCNVSKIEGYMILINKAEIIDILDKIDVNDIILLDVEMEKNFIDEIIKFLRQYRYRKPYIIAMAKNKNIIKQLNNYDEYIYKTFCKEDSFDKITQVINEIVNNDELENIKVKVRKELELFDIQRTSAGYIYLEECIILAIQDKERLHNLRVNLYEKVSESHNNIGMKKIKWSIDKCIDKIHENTNISTLKRYFYMDIKQKLTPKIFITTVVERLSYDL